MCHNGDSYSPPVTGPKLLFCCLACELKGTSKTLDPELKDLRNNDKQVCCEEEVSTLLGQTHMQRGRAGVGTRQHRSEGAMEEHRERKTERNIDKA